MANIVPGCIWRPVAIDYSKWPKRRKGRGLMGHIAVSDSPDLRGNPAGNCWTFYLPFVGPAIQQIDLDYVSGAAKVGDATMATFESQGGTGTTADANRSTWNDNQLDWAARILRHMHETEGVPLQVMPDSRPESRGFATHRLGIDPYRVVGGEVWSGSYAKACPGDARHAQRFEVVRRAAGGTDVEDDMFTDADRNTLKRLENDPGPGYGPDRLRDVYNSQRALTAQVGALTAAVQALATAGGLDAAEMTVAAQAGADAALAALGDRLRPAS